MANRRLFVAIDLDEASRQAIATIQGNLARALSKPAALVRLVKPEQMHLTLAFLGEIEDAQAPAVIEAMGEHVPARPYTIVFGGFGLFPPVGPPRILWLGLASGARETIDVHRRVTGRLADLGHGGETRAFHPHLTLGRWRTPPAWHVKLASRSWDLLGALEPAMARADIAPLAVEYVTLYESRLSPAGPAYTPLARAWLQS